MSPVESQAACMGCLVQPPYNPRNPYFAPLYSPMYEPWPLESWSQQHGVAPAQIQIHPPTSLADPPMLSPVDCCTPHFVKDRVVLTDDEKQVLALLAQAWNKFNDLDKKCPSDNPEFLDSIHRAQQIVGLRVARRVNPEVWTQASEG